MENYGFEFKMKDMVSSPFAKMVANVNHGFDTMEQRITTFESRFGRVANRINRLNQSLGGIEARRTLSLDARQLQNAENQVNRLRTQLGRLSRTQRISNPIAPQTGGFNAPQGSNTGGFAGGSLLGMASNPYVAVALAGVMAVKKVAEIGGQLSDKGFEYERNRFGITQYTGSQATSEKYIDKMGKTSTGKMFGSDAISGFQQAVMGFGNAEKSFEFVTKRLSNISAGSGVSIADLAGIQSKTRMQGYVQMDEASQWSERKIPLLKYLEKATKLNSSELIKSIEKRQVKVESFDKALELMTTGKGIYSGMTDKAMQSGFGQKLAFTNGSDMMMQKAGNGFNELFMNRFYKAGNTFLDALDKNTPKISASFSQLAMKLEMANTPLKGFGSQIDFATKAANGFTSVLTGFASIGGYFADSSSKTIEKQARMELKEKQIFERIGLYGKQLKDNFSGVFDTPKLKKGESGFAYSFSRAETLRGVHSKEINTMEQRHKAQNSSLERAVDEKKNLFVIKNQASHMKKKVEVEKEPKNTGSNTGTVGMGLGSATSTGGGVKNITLNISSLINQVQMIKENGKGLDTDQVRRILHEELTATIASVVMMGTGN